MTELVKNGQLCVDEFRSGLGNGLEASQALAIQNVNSIEEAEISENHSRINTSQSVV